MVYLAIALTFAQLVPLVLPACLAMFILRTFADKNNILLQLPKVGIFFGAAMLHQLDC